MACHVFTHEISKWEKHFSHNVPSLYLNYSTLVYLNKCRKFDKQVWSVSPDLLHIENLTSKFGQSLQICCREKEKEENNGNCKAFCVTHKRKNVYSEM